MRARFGGATAIIWVAWEGLTDSSRSVQRPVLRNFGDQPAYGPNISERSPATKRVSRWGTLIGGAPTAALPYPFASWRAMTSGSVQRSHWPEIGKPPKPRLSSIPDFCRRGSAQPPAPTQTDDARTTPSAPSVVDRTSTRQAVPI